jgi:hypothetical protein
MRHLVEGLAVVVLSCINLTSSVAALEATPTTRLQAYPFPKTMVQGQRLFWEGPLFGRLTKAGREHLIRHGFCSIPPSDVEAGRGCCERLSFVWPNKSGPQWEVDDATAAYIRPFPKRGATDLLDDKIELSRIFQGTDTVLPRFISTPDEAVQDSLYFVKHRHGAQGKSVYVFNQHELKDWWLKAKNRHDFLIQEEIVPVLYNDYKFVLRAHILLFQRNNDGNNDGSLVALLHREIICQMHSVPYYQSDGSPTKNAAWISQAGGKKLPEPLLLDNLDPSHPAARAFPEIEACSQNFAATIAPMFSKFRNSMSPETTCFALLGGDIVLQEDGTAKMCEVNSHPALGWGTMSKVPKNVFDSLIEDSLSILMVGDAAIEDTGYQRLLFSAVEEDDSRPVQDE